MHGTQSISNANKIFFSFGVGGIPPDIVVIEVVIFLTAVLCLKRVIKLRIMDAICTTE